jgi:hypothetical protein
VRRSIALYDVRERRGRAGVVEAEEANEKLGGFSVLSLLDMNETSLPSRQGFLRVFRSRLCAFVTSRGEERSDRQRSLMMRSRKNEGVSGQSWGFGRALSRCW